ncbi:hypothetical protein LTR79_009620 [Exophiala xenobiotica]|nr:hypothetical protein LTR79_009620 [Exophiala xenobiotica]KAK5411772.1 hypothetical protein LTR90_007333 [Exophiala xenobiotica]
MSTMMPTVSHLVARGDLLSRALAFFIITVLVLSFRGLWRRYASPLRQIPGPFLASCTRLWKVLSTYSGHTEWDYIALHQKYGPVVRVAPNELSFASPNAARDIFAVGKGFTKTEFYKVFPPAHNPDIFTETREWKHAQMKRAAVTPYSLASMQKRAHLIEDVQKQLVETIDRYVSPAGKICDLGNLLHYFAFDVIGEVAFSQRYGFLAKEEDVGSTIKVIDSMQWYNGMVGQVPELRYLFLNNPLVVYLQNHVLPPPLLTGMALGEIRKRKENSSDKFYLAPDRKDLLGQLLEAHDAHPERFSELDVFSVAHGAIGAGSDSTASTMQSFWYFVLNDKGAYNKLKDEAREAYKDGSLSESVTWAEAQELTYFQMCLKEAMRLRPAVGLSIQRYVPQGGAMIDGKHYPEGVAVSVNAWPVHRDKALFGQDAESFRPERWESRNLKEMEKHLYQFGGGSHLCIGRNLALLEMNKILPQLLTTYDFELIHPGRPLKSHSHFFCVNEGLEVFVRRV